MADVIKIELVTPSEMLFSDSAEMVVIPGSEGVFGVLPRHAATLANLQHGTLKVYNNGAITRRFLIDGGVADVLPERVIILAERAVDLDAVSTQHLDEQLVNATEAEAAFVNAVKEAV
ncbi:MAG: ATP synthase F1 subunit epsilon [Alphaproteobacteria bacterium]|jgi:F-type H+-transporting ATPase subunit epsilon|nr:ATP synthase F1 subunit epsilon [Alphaproteobacteria bacterium]